MIDQPTSSDVLPAVIAQAVAGDLDTARRRAVALVERIDDGRTWARRNLTAEQQAGLFAALAGRGGEPDEISLRKADVDYARADRAEAAIERVREAAAWLRRNYPGLDAGQRILAALEPPKEQP